MFGSNFLTKGLFIALLACLVHLNVAFAAQPDVRLVVDISGSMKRTDPNNLRIPATNLLIDLLPKNSRAGIWTFGSYVNQLVEPGTTTEAWRNKARSQAQRINSVAMFTDIENAIERAAWDYKRPNNKTAKHLILISDGLVDISEAATAASREAENQKSRDALLRQLTPELAKAGYTIHTLALSDESDHDLMATLAQRTGGLHIIAHEDKDLMPALLQIINRLAPSEEVPLANNRFLIDKTIDEFTLLAFHDDAAQAILHSPEGKTFTAKQPGAGQKWHGNSSYTLVTVKAPNAGQWYIETPEHPDNRVTVISDIRFNSKQLPPTIYRGYPVNLETWFTEESKLIDKREFLRILQVKAKNKKSGMLLAEFDLQLDASKPYFVAQLEDGFNQLGEQNLTIEVDGRTFNRQVNHSFNVQDVIAASLQLPEDGSSPRIILRAQHPDIQPAEVSFLIDSNNKPLQAQYRGDGEWKVDLASLDPQHNHQINLLVQTKKNGQPLRIELPSIKLAAKEPVPAPTPSTDSEIGVIPNPTPQIPLAVIPMGGASTEPESNLNQNTTTQTPTAQTPTAPAQSIPAEKIVSVPEAAPELAEEISKEPANLPKVGMFDGLFAPIESWDDPRMPWIYIGLGVANIILFLVAFLMYRGFINKRKAKQGLNPKEPEALEDLEDSMDDLLDEFGEEDSNR